MESDKLLERWLKRKNDNSKSKSIDKSNNDIPLKPKDIKTPLSFGQQRLLFLQHLFPDNPFYNYADAYELNGTIEINHLLEGFKRVVQRHSILRTTYHFEEDQVIQTVEPDGTFNYTFFDLSKESVEKQKEEARKLAVNVSQESFDLSKGPLMNVSLIKYSATKHLMVITMHHIITDKWSMKVLRAELSNIYNALINDQEPKLNPLPFQYEDYAYWQRSKTLDAKSLGYWKEKLTGSVPVLNLPSDHKRSVRPTFKGAYLTKNFSKETSSQLRALSKKSNVTLYVLLLTVYKVLLNRYSGQEDILVGTPFTNRDQTSLESLIGFFNETLVLRSDLSEDPRFSDLLNQVRGNVLDAFSHQGIPFETLVKELKPERYISSNPLFQVMFIFHEVPETPSFGSSLELKHEPFDFGVAKFDLTLYIADKDGQLSATIEYASDLFEKSTIERMQDHLAILVEDVLQNPEKRISNLSLISKPEQEQLMIWNDNKTPELNVENLHQLFEKHANEKPEEIALIVDNDKISYKDLNEKANKVATHLKKLGLPPNSIVGLCASKSTDLIVGILGILKSGGAYLPIDPEYPLERIEFMLKDTNAPFLLTQEKHLDKLTKSTSQRITFKEVYEQQTAASQPENNPVKSTDLAYIIYTSGSSGMPKGVPVSHGNIVHSTTARFSFFPNQPQRFLLLSSFAFDSSCVGIFWTLCSGGTLVLAKEKIEQDMWGLSDLISQNQITHTLLLPSLYNLLLKQSDAQQLKSLQTVIVAGEACASSLCHDHFECLPEVELYNEYGPTEASVWCTVHQLKREDTGNIVPIGRPISNTEILILDDRMVPVPIGIAGEIYVGGLGITNGYLNREDLTKERFLDHPFEKETNKKIYRTGDLGRYRPDGIIEFLGRADLQVKIRGYRIELNEIKEILNNYSAVTEAVVIVKQANSFSFDDDKNEATQVLIDYLETLDDETVEELLNPIENLSTVEQDYLSDKI